MQSMALLLGPIGGGLTSGLAGIGAVYVTIGFILVGAAIAAALLIREPKGFGGAKRAADGG